MLAALALAASIVPAQTVPPAASVSVKVEVPASMQAAPFNVGRSLTVPPEFKISVYTRIAGARFMAITPDGNLLVSVPNSGRIFLVRRNASGDPTISTFVSGLRRPHDMVFATFGSNTYLYVAESHQINRYLYRTGDTIASSRQIIITGLPDASSPELGGSYGHQLKNIAIGPDGSLYVSIASATNASITDAISNPVRCAIYRYNSDGTGGRLFARGLRNAEGLAFAPGTANLWVTVNQRDQIRYPFHSDFDGDGLVDFGKRLPTYLDDHPPDAFTHVVDGANYGWPYANSSPDTSYGLTNMPFDPDYETNRDWTQFPHTTFTRISKGIQAHSAPLGLSFLQASAVPAEYKNGAVIALHGSWNRTLRTGFKVIYFPWLSSGTPGTQMDLVRGWLDSATQTFWGRPVDVIPDQAGDLLISDDYSGTIYRLSRPTSVPSTGPRITALKVVDTDTNATIAPLTNGTIIDLSSNPHINIVAETAPGTSGSVTFSGTGVPIGGGEAIPIGRLDSAVPFAIGGDNGAGKLYAWIPQAGNGTYQLHITPYALPARAGTVGTPRDVSFSVIKGPQRVLLLSLINADTSEPIPGFNPIRNSATIVLSQLPTQNISIQAFTSPASVGSVQFALTGAANRNFLKSAPPYTLAGDIGGNIHPLAPSLSPGSYTLRATPYTHSSGGVAGSTTTVSFTVQ